MEKIKIVETGKIVDAPSVQTSTDGYIDNPSRYDLWSEIVSSSDLQEDNDCDGAMTQDALDYWTNCASMIEEAIELEADIDSDKMAEYRDECQRRMESVNDFDDSCAEWLACAQEYACAD
jgi:hypothetical protein